MQQSDLPQLSKKQTIDDRKPSYEVDDAIVSMEEHTPVLTKSHTEVVQGDKK